MRDDLRMGAAWTATEVAHRRQFSNPGLFARYEERFGEQP